MKRTLMMMAALIGATASVASAQFLITPYRLRGEPAPGMDANFFTFDRSNIGPGGHILMLGDTDGTTTSDDFVYINSTLIAREGNSAPDTGTSTFGTFELLDSGSHINLNGDAVFASSLGSAPTTANAALFKHVAGTTGLIIREGDEPHGISGRTVTTWSFPGIFSDGDVGYILDLNDAPATDDSVIYRRGNVIYREGSQVPFLPAGTAWDGNFTEADWNGSGAVLFWGNTNSTPTSSDQILARDINGTGTVVMREGDLINAASGPAPLNLVLQVAIAENNTWAFRGTLGGLAGTEDSFVLTENGFFVQEGSPAPGMPAGIVHGNFNGIDINSLGDVLYLTDLEGTGAPNEGLFVNNQLIIASGDPAPGLPAGTFINDIAFEEAFINDQRVVIFGASYNGAVIGDGIFTLLVPEPGSVGLAAIAAGAMALRRRRRA